MSGSLGFLARDLWTLPLISGYVNEKASTDESVNTLSANDPHVKPENLNYTPNQSIFLNSVSAKLTLQVYRGSFELRFLLR